MGIFNAYLLIKSGFSWQNVFENNSFLAGIVYNHKSIFEYSAEFKIIIIKNNYDLIEE